jgi:hypothetical protein
LCGRKYTKKEKMSTHIKYFAVAGAVAIREESGRGRGGSGKKRKRQRQAANFEKKFDGKNLLFWAVSH